MFGQDPRLILSYRRDNSSDQGAHCTAHRAPDEECHHAGAGTDQHHAYGASQCMAPGEQAQGQTHGKQCRAGDGRRENEGWGTGAVGDEGYERYGGAGGEGYEG